MLYSLVFHDSILLVSTLQQAGNDADLAMLRGQVDMLLQDSNRILNTALWTMGIAAAFVVAVTGILSLFSIRLSRREREALETDLKGTIATEMAQVREELARYAESQASSLDERAKEHRALLDAQLELISKELDNTVRRAVEASTAKIKHRVSVLDSRSQDIDLNLRDLKAEFADHLGVEPNTLSAYIRLGVAALSYNVSWRVHYSLEAIERLVRKNSSFSSFEESELTDFLRSLPDEFEVARDRIVSVLKG